MLRLFKQFFCKHDFEKTSVHMLAKHRGYIVPVVEYKCRKCGKVVRQ